MQTEVEKIGQVSDIWNAAEPISLYWGSEEFLLTLKEHYIYLQ